MGMTAQDADWPPQGAPRLELEVQWTSVIRAPEGGTLPGTRLLRAICDENPVPSWPGNGLGVFFQPLLSHLQSLPSPGPATDSSLAL